MCINIMLIMATYPCKNCGHAGESHEYKTEVLASGRRISIWVCYECEPTLGSGCSGYVPDTSAT